MSIVKSYHLNTSDNWYYNYIFLKCIILCNEKKSYQKDTWSKNQMNDFN